MKLKYFTSKSIEKAGFIPSMFVICPFLWQARRKEFGRNLEGIWKEFERSLVRGRFFLVLSLFFMICQEAMFVLCKLYILTICNRAEGWGGVSG